MASAPAPRQKNVGDDLPGSAPTHAVEIGLAALALLALLGSALSLRATAESLRREAHLVEELRASRDHTQALSQVLDVWQFSTDAQHRLVAMRPPEDADASIWSTLPVTDEATADKPYLWDCFHAGMTGNRSLRAKLDAHATLDQIDTRLVMARPVAIERRHDSPQADSADTVPGETGENPTRNNWRLRAVPRFDARGRFSGYIGTAREIDAGPRRADGSRAPSSDIAPPANAPDSAQMAADSQAFSYTVSHDLRAPIRVVEGFTKILKEDYGRQLDRVGNDHLDRVLGAAARMNSMIDALLSLAQLQATPLVRQPINLSQLAHYIVDDLRRQSPEREVSVHIEPGMQVRGDPTLLRIALENLLGNAWKYTAKRRLAQIWFESETLEQGPAYTVRDNGAGFDMRFADRLFGVFQRLHSANDFQGTGVGLASVRRIIKRHDGEIWAESEPERGARFHFTLPQRAGR